MCKRLIYVVMFVFALGSTAHAALYLWNGSAGDGNWDTVLNWTVTDSLWTWPNEEFGNKNVNSDATAIDILNGDVVTRAGELAIQGAADGSTTAVLTVNGSSLTVNGDLETNDGEGHIIISGNATVNVGDDLELANEPSGVGTVDISGTATVTITDDIDLGKKGVGTLNISGDATLDVPDELYIGDDEGSVGHMTISGNATVTVVDDIDVGDNGPGTCDISENATVHVVDSIKISDNGGEGHLTVSGTATVNVDDDIEPGCSPTGLGTCDIGENATVNVGDDFELGVDPGCQGHLTISGDASVTCVDILVGVSLESITSLTINGGETIIDDLIMGSGEGDPSIGQSRVFINGGLLQAEGLSIAITDSQIVFSGGEFRINNASVSEADMQQLITDGTVAPTGDYNITTDGAYTVLSGPPEPTGVNIIWVSTTRDRGVPDGIQDDQGFIDLLTAEGHNLDVRLDYWNELDLEPAKVDELNAADLVIISRSTSSGDHDDGDEPALWNSVTTPMILTTTYIVRTSKWAWMNTDDVNQVDALLMAVDPTHPVFDGVTLEMGMIAIAYDNTVSAGFTTFPPTIDVGNGTLIAQTFGVDCAAIVEWDAGVEMYPGSGAIAGGPRMFFACGSHEKDADGVEVGPQGAYNLTADGEKMFLNAIAYMLPAAEEPAPADVTAPGDTVLGVPNDGLTVGSNFGWPAAETPDLAVDDDTATKFLHFKGEIETTGFQVTPASGPSIVTGLTFTTANDAVERDPIAFELSGSNESIDGPYELIASGDIVDFAQADAWPRFTMNATPISFDNDVAYAHYQVLFPAVRDAGSANSMQIAEVELLGVPAIASGQ